MNTSLSEEENKSSGKPKAIGLMVGYTVRTDFACLKCLAVKNILR